MTEIACEAMILDHDDTGIITRSTEYERMRELGQKYGLSLTTAQLDASWGMGFEEQLDFLYGSKAAPIDELVTSYSDLSDRYPRRANHGYLDLLAQAEAAGIPYGIVSSHNASLIDGELRQIGAHPERHMFIHGSLETHPFYKPDKRAFGPAVSLLSAMGITPEETVYIGDDIKDLSAEQVGWTTVAVTTGIHSAQDFEQHGARHIVDGLDKIGVAAGKLIVPTVAA